MVSLFSMDECRIEGHVGINYLEQDCRHSRWLSLNETKDKLKRDFKIQSQARHRQAYTQASSLNLSHLLQQDLIYNRQTGHLKSH